MKKDISRRNFLKILGGGAVATAAVMTGCKSKSDSKAVEEYKKQVEPPTDKMTYRTNPKTGDKVSILGYGMMRLPSKTENKDDSKSPQALRVFHRHQAVKLPPLYTKS